VNVHLRDLRADSGTIIWHHIEPARLKEGETVRLTSDPEHMHIFDEAGRALELH